MVKHQRRSHARGIHGMDMLDDCTSESEMGDNPATPGQTPLGWAVGIVPSQAGHSMTRANSFADFGGYNMQFGHRHSLSSDASNFSSPMVVQRSLGHSPFYVIDQENPAIATMNPNMQPYSVPRQTSERPAAIDLTYANSGIATPSNSSPAFSPPANTGSPLLSEGFYTTQGAQNATYALQNAADTNSVAQYPSPEADNGSWYNYQAPVDVSIVPSYGFDIYTQPKLDFEDPSMQLPSSRLAAL